MVFRKKRAYVDTGNGSYRSGRFTDRVMNSTASLAIALFEAAADERDPADVYASAASGRTSQERDQIANLADVAERTSIVTSGDDAVAAPFSEFVTFSDVRQVINRALHILRNIMQRISMSVSDNSR